MLEMVEMFSKITTKHTFKMCLTAISESVSSIFNTWRMKISKCYKG